MVEQAIHVVILGICARGSTVLLVLLQCTIATEGVAALRTFFILLFIPIGNPMQDITIG